VSELELTLVQPAQIGDRARKNFVLSTMEYIPGSVVRGAFAAAWLARHGASAPGTRMREEFLGIFEGGVRFGPLFRDGTEFMSLAVVGHKYDPTEDCAIVDYDRAVSDEDPPQYCPDPDCDSPLEQRRGLHGDRPAPARRTSVAIGEHGTAVPGQLFSRELLGAGQVFRGTITATDKQWEEVLKDLGPVRIGGRRTTHGLAEVAVRDGGTPPTAQRRPDGDLVIRLRSPGIFTDEYGRPAREPFPHDLERALGIPARVVPGRSWTRWEQVGGWHAASGLPKQQELAVAVGSTFVIHPERVVDDTNLHALAVSGLGLRRHEGFGDLAPPPVLRPGRAERDAAAAAEAVRVTALLAGVVGLSRLRFDRTGHIDLNGWHTATSALRAHARGDVRATAWLRQLAAEHPVPDVRAGVGFFLGLPTADAAYVVQELSR
jgi:CRISPR-associated protein Csx10